MPWSGGNDLHVSSAQRKLSPSFHLASPCRGIAHHLSGLNSNALAAYSFNIDHPQRDSGLAYTRKVYYVDVAHAQSGMNHSLQNANIEQLVRQYQASMWYLVHLSHFQCAFYLLNHNRIVILAKGLDSHLSWTPWSVFQDGSESDISSGMIYQIDA